MPETIKPKFDRSNFLFTPCGKSIVKRYESKYDEELGREIVKEADDFDIYEFIQASSNNTDLSMLREQMVRTGQIPQVDTTLQYGQDTSLMPTSIHELYDVVGNVNNTFDELPDHVKAAFDNNPSKFMSALMDGSYMDVANKAVNEYYVALAKKQEEEAKKKEGEK